MDCRFECTSTIALDVMLKEGSTVKWLTGLLGLPACYAVAVAGQTIGNVLWPNDLHRSIVEIAVGIEKLFHCVVPRKIDRMMPRDYPSVK